MIQQTIFISGATGYQGKLLAEALAKHSAHRIMLADEDQSALTKLYHNLCTQYPGANVEMATCLSDACWEADIIALDHPLPVIIQLSDKIRELANRKLIIHFLSADIRSSEDPAEQTHPVADWKKWFPHTSVVKAYIGSIASLLDSNEPQALHTATGLFTAARLNPFTEERQQSGINAITEIYHQKQ